MKILTIWIDMKKLFFFFCLCTASLGLSAQEFMCAVSVNAGRIQGDKQIFDEMRRSITEYINDFKWTNDQFDHFERIRWQLRIQVNNRRTADQFEARAIIQAYRPIFGSTEETLLFTMTDPFFDFRYVVQQQMPHIENTYQDNLTALLNFYSYIVLAFDYGSFSPNGGEAYLRQAEEVLNQAANSGSRGWLANDGQQTRYWLVENLRNNRYKSFHEALYTYHRQGMDQMVADVNTGRKAIIDSLRKIEDLQRENNLLFLKRVFTDTKSDELKNIFTGALPNQKQEFLQIMERIDPARMSEYNGIMN